MTDSFAIRNSAFGIRLVPPEGNANFAWVQYFIHHLAPQNMAGVDFVCLRFASSVLANGSMFSNQFGEGDDFESAFWMKTISLPQPATAWTIYR